jgi:SAM-dependent methyltransferase
MTTTIRFGGSGPGPQTLDGCSVELWKLLPAGDDPSLIASVVPVGGSVLELGAGVGRVAHPLLELGYRVCAVDNSAEMLAQIKGAALALSDIEDLALGSVFDAVLLGSYLIHAPAPGARAALLKTCRLHVAPTGVVLVQHYGNDWPAKAVRGFQWENGGVKTFIDDVAVEGRLVQIAMRHEAGGGTWTQNFTTEPLTHSEIAKALTGAGLEFVRHIDNERRWSLARPIA